MPRKKTILSSQFPYHVTSRSNHKTWFQLDLKDVWTIALKALEIAASKHPVEIHAFVLMSNHYHLVLRTPDANINQFMYEFNKNFSLSLRIKTRLINRMFGGRYKWSLIEGQNYYFQVMKYVFLNPIKARLVGDARNYPYSTLFYQYHGQSFPVPLTPFIDTLDFNFLAWIHQGHNELQRESISRGLLRSIFRYSGSRQIRRPPIFDEFG